MLLNELEVFRTQYLLVRLIEFDVKVIRLIQKGSKMIIKSFCTVRYRKSIP